MFTLVCSVCDTHGSSSVYHLLVCDFLRNHSITPRVRTIISTMAMIKPISKNFLDSFHIINGRHTHTVIIIMTTDENIPHL